MFLKYAHGEPRKKGDKAPVKWCNYCGAKHPARDCDMIDVLREAKSGKEVIRFTRWELMQRAKDA